MKIPFRGVSCGLNTSTEKVLKMKFGALSAMGASYE